MSDSKNMDARCLCGKVEFSVTKPSNNIGACHCSTCRQWGGGPFLAVDCGTELDIKGEDNLSIYQSSDWAERGFCKSCGTHLFYRLKQSGQTLLTAGLFPQGTEFVFDHQVFIDEKPDYYCFANKTQDMTGAEVFAKFGAS